MGFTRGGGGNFGIATSYTFRFRPISTVTLYEATWGERDWQHLSELLSVWQELAPSAPDGLGSVFFASSKAAGTITSWHLHRIGGGTAAPAAPTAAGDR